MVWVWLLFARVFLGRLAVGFFPRLAVGAGSFGAPLGSLLVAVCFLQRLTPVFLRNFGEPHVTLQFWDYPAVLEVVKELYGPFDRWAAQRSAVRMVSIPLV